MWIGIGVGVVVVLAVVAFLLVKRKRQLSNFAGAEAYRSLMGMQPAASATNPATEALRQNLRVKYLYQEDKIDAAIAYERERNPSANEEQAMQAAITRWERDNN